MGKDYIILKNDDINKKLDDLDQSKIDHVERLYKQILDLIVIREQNNEAILDDKIIDLYAEIGDALEKYTEGEKIFIYPFKHDEIYHAEASRLISKLRDIKTEQQEFTYYIQRSFELLFQQAYVRQYKSEKNYFLIKTPVINPCQNYGLHKIPNVDEELKDTVVCVMLRAALLPSMIIAKEIEENTSNAFVPPFALFRIKRNDDKELNNMEYILDLKKSFYNKEELNGKDLIFADPMNATGGSFISIIKHLEKNGIKPKSIKLFHVITSLQGALNVVRSLENVEVHSLWMDPVLNDKAYILPGLGDAGDRLNGKDANEYPRNIMQLIADYGVNIINLYRAQVREIEKIVFGS